MALKLIFRYNRANYDRGTEYEKDNKIKQNLKNVLDSMGITSSHMYTPSRQSVKVIFPTEADIDKVMEKEEEIKAEGFEPRMSLSLKACRTIFCTNFDPTLLTTYSKENIMEILKQQKWKVKDIYIMKSNKSFKIEMSSRMQAKNFLEKESINIGGIRLDNNSKEPEIDPTIKQCWECGILNPNHNSQECTGRKICIKCGDIGHKFYQCYIPRDERDMSDNHKARRFCAACGLKGTHTTLDHKLCQKKRDILRERARIEREKRIAKNESENRETELIRKVIDINNQVEFPITANQTQQQSAINTILTLVLIDEANNPGIFEEKLEESLTNNGLPAVKYTLEPGTATKFQNILCGAHTIPLTPNIPQASSPYMSRFARDQLKHQKRNANQEENDESERGAPLNPIDKKQRLAEQVEEAQNSDLPEDSEAEMEEDNENDELRKLQALQAQYHKQLKDELDRYWIIKEGNINEEKVKMLTLEKILTILSSQKIKNKIEWTIMVKALTEKLIKLGLKDTQMQIKVRQMTKETEQDFQ